MPPVHAGDSVLSGSEVPGRGLQIDECEDPVVGAAFEGGCALDIVVLRGDRNVLEVVRRRDLLLVVAEPVGCGALHEGRLSGISDHEPPRFVVGESRRQVSQQPLPFGRGSRRRRFAVPVHGDHPELGEEGMPGVALVRPQRRECRNAVRSEFLVHRRQRRGRRPAVDQAHADQGVGQQVVHAGLPRGRSIPAVAGARLSCS